MKIRRVEINARRRSFDVHLSSRTLSFPFAKAAPAPTAADPVRHCSVDPEIAREGFTYELESGRGGTVHVDQVLEYHQDPRYVRQAVLYQLTLEARHRLSSSGLTKREIARRLSTSQAQLFRLLDQTNSRKSVDNMLALLAVLDCEVQFVVRQRGETAAEVAAATS